MTSFMARTCVRHADGTLRSPMNQNFIWPSEVGSVVTAPDWDPEPTCGGGLHGLRPGQQNPGHWVTGPDAVYLVCSFEEEDAVDLDGSVKVRQCRVECVGTAADYTNFLTALGYRKLYGAHYIYAKNLIVAGNDAFIDLLLDSDSIAHLIVGDHANVICRGAGKALISTGVFFRIGIAAGQTGPFYAKGTDMIVLCGGVDECTDYIKTIGTQLQPNVSYHADNGAFVELPA